MDIFVSYAWVDESPDDNVLNLVAILRENGFNAVCDVILRQRETAIHFTKMMAACLQKADKVIVVLSEKYKEKADSFKGGVGDEYQYIIEDIKAKSQKYIFVTFEADRDKVTPDFIKGRDVLLLNKPEILCNDLLHKICGTNPYIFSSVNPKKAQPDTMAKKGKISDAPSDQEVLFSVSNNEAENMFISKNVTIIGGIHFGGNSRKK